LRDLLDGQAAVVRVDDGVDRRQAGAHLGNGRGLLFVIQSRHLLVSARRRSPADRPREAAGAGAEGGAPERHAPRPRMGGPRAGFRRRPAGRPPPWVFGRSPYCYRSAPTSSSRFVVFAVSSGTPGPIV